MTKGDVDLLVGAHGIDTALQSVVEGALVEEHQGIHGLVLGGGRDIAVHGQVREERLDVRFRREEIIAGPHAVETDVAHDPLQVGSLGMNRVVVHAENLSDLLEKCWLLTSGRARHIVSSVNDALKVLITSIGQNCLKTPLLSHYQRKSAS